MLKFIKALQIMSIVSEWSVRALQDNKVTLKEATDLATQICSVLNVKLEINLP